MVQKLIRDEGVGTKCSQWYLKIFQRFYMSIGVSNTSFSRWMTIFSFASTTWIGRFKFYVPSKLSNKSSKQFGANSDDREDYMRFFTKIVNIWWHGADVRVSNDLSEVHKSDILRLHVCQLKVAVGLTWTFFFSSPWFSSFNRPEYADYNTAD